MSVSYTHNLKLILVDDEDNVVTDGNIKSKFEMIKSLLFQENTHTIRWNNTNENYTIKWDMIKLDKLEQRTF